VVRFAGGDHQQDPVGAPAFLSGPDGPLDRLLTNGDSRNGDIADQVRHRFAATEALQNLVGVFKLGHPGRIAQVGHLDVPEPGQDQLFGQPDLCVGRDECFFMLKTVPDGDIADGYFLRSVHC